VVQCCVLRHSGKSAHHQAGSEIELNYDFRSKSEAFRQFAQIVIKLNRWLRQRAMQTYSRYETDLTEQVRGLDFVAESTPPSISIVTWISPAPCAGIAWPWRCPCTSSEVAHRLNLCRIAPCRIAYAIASCRIASPQRNDRIASHRIAVT
jgi:hypothetical protein